MLAAAGAGPVWHSLNRVAIDSMAKIHEEQITRNQVGDLLPLATLRKHQYWLQKGDSRLADLYISALA